MPVHVLIATRLEDAHAFLDALTPAIDDAALGAPVCWHPPGAFPPLPEPWTTLATAFPAVPDAAPADGAAHPCFLLLDPRVSLIGQLETLRDWLAANHIELARIITLVDCAAAAGSDELRRWLDAAIHFSDAVLLGRRNDTPAQWVAEFRRHYEKACYPCSFHLLRKDSRVEGPAVLLHPDTRRLSQVFDRADDPEESTAFQIEASFDPQEEDSLLPPEADPYFATLPSGQRRRPLPDISPWVSW
jgi:hypothetical protein